MKHRTARSFSLVLVAPALLAAGASLLTPADAEAQIYRYERADGTVEFTSEPIAGETPTEVIGGPPRRERPIASPPSTPNPNPERDPSAFDAYIRAAATNYDIPFEFIKAVIRVESAFDPHAVSHAGAMGLMQLMPRTAESLNCADPFDPEQNIMAGTQYLHVLADRYDGDINLVLAAYNAGSGAVAQYDGIPYEATRRYIERVWEYYQGYLEVAAVP